MNFFTQLASLGQGMDINLRIKGKNGRLTVAIEPQMANVSRLTPLVLTGTPEELDEGFIAQFDGAITTAKGLESNLADVKKDAADLASKAAAKKETKTVAKLTQKQETKKDVGKSAKKPDKPRKQPKPVPVPGDMFGQPLVDPDPAGQETRLAEEADEADTPEDAQEEAGGAAQTADESADDGANEETE